MKLVNRYINLNSKGQSDVIDITEKIESILQSEDMSEGMVHMFIPGATGSITTIEYENGLIGDIRDAWERIAPGCGFYRHDRYRNDDNSHSHIRASIIGPSLCVPFKKKRLVLGRWQRIVFIDFDTRPREREIVVQVMGN